MAHQPLLPPYPSGSPDPEDEPLFALGEGAGAEADLAALARKLAAHGGSETSTDLALDLVLNQIVEQARLATTATGAAIALFRDKELVCRAASGMNAPELGVRLNSRSGLSGACVTTGQVQKCDDSEVDLRADAVALRLLGIRSILVVPIVEVEELVGIFEIFSPRPNAFGERDVQTLEALSRRIVVNLGRAAETAAPTPVLIEPEPATAVIQEEIAPAPDVVSARVVMPPVVRPKRDGWTDVLNALVIGLALLLGWMVGREGWHEATRMSRRQVEQPATPVTQASNPAPVKSAPPAAKSTPTPKSVESRPVKKAKPMRVAETPNAGGLVVYQNGKVVYRWTGEATASADSAPVYISPDIAATYIVRRVEPVYPDSARQEGIHGAVVLDTTVARDGTVRELKDVSGDPQLAAAAVEAVRQWRFKPYSPAGSAKEFRTSITLNFAP